MSDTPKNDSLMLRRLLEIARQMSETRALHPLLVYIVDAALETLNAEYGYVVLVKEDGSLEFVVNRDRHGNDIVQPENQISRTILYRVMDDRKPVVTADAIEDSNLNQNTSVRGLRLRSVACVPLITQGKSIGVLYLENRQRRNIFLDADLEPLQFIANHAAVCIENTRLNSELERRYEERTQQLREVSYQFALEAADHASMGHDLRLLAEQERMRILSNFFQDASHQFRTPLSIINANVDIMRRKLGTHDYDAHFQKIRAQVDAIAALVDSLNMLVRLDSRDMLDLQPLDLNHVLREMFEVFHLRAEKNRIRMEYTLAETPVWIQGSREYLRIALNHVLDNAIRYTQATGKVTCAVHVMEHTAEIRIADTGQGIAPDALPHIFTRFYRVDTAGTTRGLGLGLSIAYKIMALHHGSIEVESRPGKGSLFRLIFPRVDGGDHES